MSGAAVAWVLVIAVVLALVWITVSLARSAREGAEPERAPSERRTSTRPTSEGERDDEGDRDDGEGALRSSVRSTGPDDDVDDGGTDHRIVPVGPTSGDRGGSADGEASTAPKLRISMGRDREIVPVAIPSKEVGAGPCPRCSTVLTAERVCPACGYEG